MKKSELKDLVERKKILKESMDIINESRLMMDEVGGFDDPEIMSQYHGNYFDELAKTFFHFDALSDDLIGSMEKIMDEEERKSAKDILLKFHSFMDAYVNYLQSLEGKVNVLATKSSRSNLPGMGNIGMNENID